MTDKKTVAQLIKEHQKRQENPEYSTLVFENGRTYHNITNYKVTGDDIHDYEFDSEWNGKITHVDIGISPIIKEKFIEDVPGYSNAIAKHCPLVLVYTNTGKTEEFIDVYDLIENKKDGTVEFDFIEDSGRCHMMLHGKITKYVAEVYKEEE